MPGSRCVYPVRLLGTGGDQFGHSATVSAVPQGPQTRAITMTCESSSSHQVQLEAPGGSPRMLGRLRRPWPRPADGEAPAHQGQRRDQNRGQGQLDGLREEKRRTGTVGRRDITVESVVRDRLANPPEDVRSRITRRVHADHAARIIAELGKVRLVQLAPSQVERFLRKMADDGYAIKTIRYTRSLLAGAIRRAERDGLVGRNAALLADLPSGTSKQSRAMTLAQVGQLLGSGLTPWWRAYVAVGVMCGLRPGELLGLRWQDVDFGEKLLKVRYALTEADGGLVLADLKTERSRRTLVMPAAVATSLRALRTQQASDRLRLGIAYADQGLVFCRTDGRPSRRQHVYKGFQRACKRAGVGVFHPHELRHTHVSVPVVTMAWTWRSSPTAWGTSTRPSPAPSTATRSPTWWPGPPRDGPDFRLRERIMTAIGSRAWLPDPRFGRCAAGPGQPGSCVHATNLRPNKLIWPNGTWCARSVTRLPTHGSGCDRIRSQPLSHA
jgi:integrase